MTLYGSISPHLITSARERRGQVPVRVMLGGLLAWSLYSVGHVQLVLPWLALSIAVQLFEDRAMAPFRREATQDVNRHRIMAPALISIFLMALAHAAAALLIWRSGGQALSTVAVLILAGGLLNNIASGIESRPLFYLGATPYLAALAAMPLMRISGWQWSHLPLLTVCVALFVMAVLGVWSRVNHARLAEIGALAEAQTRLEQAEAAMADRAAMAAIVSHELRTPVSAILAGAQVIHRADRPEAVAETAELITDAGRLMTEMLNDLLDHSKIQARAMTLEARDFDLNGFIQDTARFWAAPAAEKGLTLRTPPPGPAVWLKGDPFRLRQIVNNLMSNALKFTAQGQVALELQSTPTEGGLSLRLTVRDQGAGIAPEAMERLFSPFAQGSAEVARTYGGTGLGLTVSRDLARLMGGDLTAESVAGEGAAFHLDLDMPIGAPVAEDAQSDARPVLGRRLRLLAVDDHEINRRTLALVLQPLDVDLTLASDGAAALERLASQPFDAVLMDVNMPGIDGNETTRRLRASGGINAGAPVIGFSAGTEAAQVQACRDAGMTDWLPKPLEPARLYRALERAMGDAEVVRTEAAKIEAAKTEAA